MHVGFGEVVTGVLETSSECLPSTLPEVLERCRVSLAAFLVEVRCPGFATGLSTRAQSGVYGSYGSWLHRIHAARR
jgi:hypothetical protein